MSGRRKRRTRQYPDGLLGRIAATVGRPVVARLSELARESLRQPGSWRCLEIVYRNEPHTLLDRFWLSRRAARGARNRLQVLTEELGQIVRSIARKDGRVRLLSLGSGPGHEVLGCIKRLQDSAVVEATCVDRDAEAIEYGESLALHKGLAGCVHYVRGDVFIAGVLPPCQDVAVLSGLLDYLDMKAAVSILTRVRETLTPGGVVLLANMRHHNMASTMSMLGNWHLVYREPREVERLLVESGYGEIKVWLESEKVFCIGRGWKLGLTGTPAGPEVAGTET